MKIIYGTGNLEKIKQMEKIIKINDIEVELLSLKDINFNQEIIENGKTFEENSKIKASYLRNYCNENGYEDYIIITDDAGLCVNCLNGEPGVFSARYAGKGASQEEILKKLLDEIEKHTTNNDRTAKFVCVLTASLPNGEYVVARGETLGTIATEVKRYSGLTYEPVFIPKGFDKPLGEMTIEEFALVKNHRDLAMLDILEKIK